MGIGTILHTWINGMLVGVDEFGNKYYRSKRKNRWGREQRWCMYKGTIDASLVPAEWNSWLHFTVQTPLTHLATTAKFWQRPHIPNMTGTSQAYRPAGHIIQGGKRRRATGDYEAWSPT